jgi:hypothetical protein
VGNPSSEKYLKLFVLLLNIHKPSLAIKKILSLYWTISVAPSFSRPEFLSAFSLSCLKIWPSSISISYIPFVAVQIHKWLLLSSYNLVISLMSERMFLKEWAVSFQFPFSHFTRSPSAVPIHVLPLWSSSSCLMIWPFNKEGATEKYLFAAGS